MADNPATMLQVSGRGTYVRIRTPAEIGGTKQQVGVVERRNEAHGVVVSYGFQMAPDRIYALRERRIVAGHGSCRAARGNNLVLT
jgi:hypothetical protein